MNDDAVGRDAPLDPAAGLTHFDASGKAVMVDVSGKAVTERIAVAEGEIRVGETVFRAIAAGTAAKGDVLGTARLAGIMAVKRTAELIPLCHPLPVSHCSIEFALDAAAAAVRVLCRVRTAGRTGVEMEALTGATIALLTVYDMTKAMGKGMEISRVRLLEKSGGASGEYRLETED